MPQPLEQPRRKQLLDCNLAMTKQMARTPGPTLQEVIPMKAIVVTDQAAGTAGMKLVERPEPPAAINDVIVQIHVRPD